MDWPARRAGRAESRPGARGGQAGVPGPRLRQRLIGRDRRRGRFFQQNERLAAGLDGKYLAEAVPELALAMRRAEPEWTHLVLEFRLHAARVPELSERYARLHERTIDALASVFTRLHERAGSTPRFPPRVLAELALGINVGAFLEQLALPGAIDLPFPQVISEMVLQMASPDEGKGNPMGS
jgi:hypothetical protein